MPPKRKGPKPKPKWSRRRSGEEGPKRLDPALEHVARGERRPRPERSPRLTDARPAPLVPGVKNTDARAVCDRRVTRLRSLVTGRPASDEALEDALAEAATMTLWRGRSLTGFDALAVDVLELEPAEARAMAERGAERLGLPIGELSSEDRAIWYRAEASLLEGELGGRVRVQRTAEGDELVLVLPTRDAPMALTAIGDRQRGLGRDFERARDRGRRDPRDRKHRQDR